MRCVVRMVGLVLLGLLAAACGSDGTPQLAAPTIGAFPESLAFVVQEPAAPAVAQSGEAPVPVGPDDAPLIGQEPDVVVDLSDDVDRLAACTAVVALGTDSISDPAEIAAAFDDIRVVFDSLVLMTVEAGVLGETEAAMALAIDPDVALQHVRLDAQTYATCGAPLYAATLGTATADEAAGTCFEATELDVSGKVALGAELNEELYTFERASCTD